MPTAHTLHIALLSSVTGMVLHTSFVTGLIQFKTLPRHIFGLLQSKQFPAYFLICSGCTTALTLTTAYLGGIAALTPVEMARELIKLDPGAIQVAAMGAAALASLLNWLVIGPYSSRVMFERHKIEKAGQQASPQLNKKFGMLHGISSLLNLVVVGGCMSNVFWTGAKWGAAAAT